MKKPRSHTDPERTRPLGLFRYATEFYASALYADDSIGEETGHEISAPAPVNYLMGHALELGLKAFLLQHGINPAQLISDFRHDLEKALAQADAFGLRNFVQLNSGERELIRLVNALYSDKQFEYLETGMKTFPVFGPYQTLVEKILLGVAKAIPDSEIVLRRKAGRRLTGY